MIANTIGELKSLLESFDDETPLDKGISVESFKAQPQIVYGKTQFNVNLVDKTKNTIEVVRVR